MRGSVIKTWEIAGDTAQLSTLLPVCRKMTRILLTAIVTRDNICSDICCLLKLCGVVLGKLVAGTPAYSSGDCDVKISSQAH